MHVSGDLATPCHVVYTSTAVRGDFLVHVLNDLDMPYSDATWHSDGLDTID